MLNGESRVQARINQIERTLASYRSWFVGMTAGIGAAVVILSVGISLLFSPIFADASRVSELLERLEGAEARLDEVRELTQSSARAMQEDAARSEARITEVSEAARARVQAETEQRLAEFRSDVEESVNLEVGEFVFDQLRVRSLEVVGDDGGREIQLTSDQNGGTIQIHGNRYEGEQLFLGIANNGGGFVRLKNDSREALRLTTGGTSGSVFIYQLQSGQRALAFGMSDAGETALWLYGPAGQSRAVLSAATPSLWLYDDEGKPSVVLRGDDEANALSVLGGEGEDLIRLRRDRSGGSVETYSSTRNATVSTRTAYLGTQTETRDGGLWLYDRAGRIRASMVAHQSFPDMTLRGTEDKHLRLWTGAQGGGSLQLYDPQGDVFMRTEIGIAGASLSLFDVATGQLIERFDQPWPTPMGE